MRKFQAKDFLKSAGMFMFVSATGIDATLWGIESIRTSDNLYLAGPLFAWGLASLPLSISLFQRMADNSYRTSGKIKPIVEPENGYTRSIPFNRNGKPGTLLTHVSAAIWGEPSPEAARQKITGWQVGDVTIGVNELSRFLELADRRTKYKFSMRYWCQKRRPPMPRKKYDATMELLTKAGLVEARQSGASGWLRGGLKPRHAMEYLTDPGQEKTANLAVISV